MVAVLAVAGCGHDRLHVRAANALHCSPDEVSGQEIDESRRHFTGCGRSIDYFCSMDARGIPYCDPEKPDPRKAVQEAAGAQFQCPTFKVVVDDVDKTTFHAKACGHEADFACTGPDASSRYACTAKADGTKPPSTVAAPAAYKP